ncbi:hypothetical protein DPMN_142395 [Dreissena polymorpha]|uniref:VWFA domain-containing protein n=2 Tax=Dreissena polymorpha TaxID=45954 RepID=A0A9D4JNF6_DREPO|nr:hypothetical protein DPMN_142395 [Dreissena polymorpha]
MRGSCSRCCFPSRPSLSQTKEQFNTQLNFVAKLIDAVNVSATEFQFAVVTFSTRAALELEFDSTLTKEELKTQVLKIPFRPGATFTHKGLDIATTLLARRQNRLAGLSIMKFVFVLTDGMSSNRQATEVAARNLRREAYVVSIGIGSEVSHKELQKIASPPDSYSLSYVYSVENFDALNTLIGRLIDATCEKCGVSSVSDIVGVIDNLSESAMNREEFQAALNSLTFIVQHLRAYGQPNGQKFAIEIIGDYDNKHVRFANATDLNDVLFKIQIIRQQPLSCEKEKCVNQYPRRNIASAIKEIITEFNQLIEGRVGARKIVLVFSSGRFNNKTDITSDMHGLYNESIVDVNAIGSGYD